jgi:hypothetical protein
VHLACACGSTYTDHRSRFCRQCGLQRRPDVHGTVCEAVAGAGCEVFALSSEAYAALSPGLQAGVLRCMPRYRVLHEWGALIAGVFPGLPYLERLRLAQSLRLERLGNGHRLYNKGEMADRLIFLTDGVVVLRRIGSVGQGSDDAENYEAANMEEAAPSGVVQAFCALWGPKFVADGLNTVSVTTASPSQVLVLRLEHLDHLLEEPAVAAVLEELGYCM